jgi:hypothetical protein
LATFNTIALSGIGRDVLLSRLQLTRKQYYSRMSALLKTGLGKREMGKYSLTTFGMILYHAQEIIGEAVNLEQIKVKFPIFETLTQIPNLGQKELC